MNYDFQVLALGGDHIGPEVVASGLQVLHKAAQMADLHIGVDEDLLGGASWDAHGRFCTDEVLSKAQQADAILVGAVGGPEWDSLHIEGPITESDGLTRLRIELEVYNALRPARAWQALHHLTPYRSDAIDGADIMVIRENCGGIYYGEPRGREVLSNGQERAFEISEYTTSEVERILHVVLFNAPGIVVTIWHRLKNPTSWRPEDYGVKPWSESEEKNFRMSNFSRS